VNEPMPEWPESCFLTKDLRAWQTHVAPASAVGPTPMLMRFRSSDVRRLSARFAGSSDVRADLAAAAEKIAPRSR